MTLQSMTCKLCGSVAVGPQVSELDQCLDQTFVGNDPQTADFEPPIDVASAPVVSLFGSKFHCSCVQHAHSLGLLRLAPRIKIRDADETRELGEAVLAEDLLVVEKLLDAHSVDNARFSWKRLPQKRPVQASIGASTSVGDNSTAATVETDANSFASDLNSQAPPKMLKMPLSIFVEQYIFKRAETASPPATPMAPEGCCISPRGSSKERFVDSSPRDASMDYTDPPQQNDEIPIADYGARTPTSQTPQTLSTDFADADMTGWDAQLNELAKLPDWMRPGSPCDVLGWMRAPVAGVSQPQLRLLCEASIHGACTQEVNFYRRFDINHGPSVEDWGAVVAEHVPRLREAVLDDFGIDLYAPSIKWVPDVAYCIKKGIAVLVGKQRPTEVVAAGIGSLRWSAARGAGVHSAWIFGERSVTLLDAAFDREEENKRTGLRSLVPIRTLALDLGYGEVVRSVRGLVTMPSQVLLSLANRLELALSEERAVREAATAAGLSVALEPKGSMALQCEVLGCERELLHHYFYCPLCDHTVLNYFSSSPVDTKAVCSVLVDGPSMDCASRRRKHGSSSSVEYKKGHPLYQSRTGGGGNLVGARVSVNGASGVVLKSGHGFYTVQIDCSGEVLCRRRTELVLLDPPPELPAAIDGQSQKKPRRPRPAAGLNQIRVGSRVEIIGDDKNAGQRGLVVVTGHGYYTINLDCSGLVVRKRLTVLRLCEAPLVNSEGQLQNQKPLPELPVVPTASENEVSAAKVIIEPISKVSETEPSDNVKMLRHDALIEVKANNNGSPVEIPSPKRTVKACFTEVMDIEPVSLSQVSEQAVTTEISTEHANRKTLPKSLASPSAVQDFAELHENEDSCNELRKPVATVLGALKEQEGASTIEDNRPAIMCRCCWEAHSKKHPGHTSHVICFEKFDFKAFEQRVAMISRLSRDRCRSEAASRILSAPAIKVDVLTAAGYMRRSSSDILNGPNAAVQNWWRSLVREDASAASLIRPRVGSNDDKAIPLPTESILAQSSKVYRPSSPKRARFVVSTEGTFQGKERCTSDDWTTSFLNRTRSFSAGETEAFQ